MGHHYGNYNNIGGAWFRPEAHYYPRFNFAPPTLPTNLNPPGLHKAPRGTVIMCNPGSDPGITGWVYRPMPGKTLLVVAQVIDLSVAVACLSKGKQWAEDDYILILNLFDVCSGKPLPGAAPAGAGWPTSLGSFIWFAWGRPKGFYVNNVPPCAQTQLSPNLAKCIGGYEIGGTKTGGVVPVDKQVWTRRYYHPNATGLQQPPVVAGLINEISNRI